MVQTVVHIHNQIWTSWGMAQKSTYKRRSICPHTAMMYYQQECHRPLAIIPLFMFMDDNPSHPDATTCTDCSDYQPDHFNTHRGCDLSLQQGDQATWPFKKLCFQGLYLSRTTGRRAKLGSSNIQIPNHTNTSSCINCIASRISQFLLRFSLTDLWGNFPWEFRGLLVPRIIMFHRYCSVFAPGTYILIHVTFSARSH